MRILPSLIVVLMKIYKFRKCKKDSIYSTPVSHVHNTPICEIRISLDFTFSFTSNTFISNTTLREEIFAAFNFANQSFKMVNFAEFNFANEPISKVPRNLISRLRNFKRNFKRIFFTEKMFFILFIDFKTYFSHMLKYKL